METALEIQRLLRRSGVNRSVTIAVQISESEELSHYQEIALMPDIRIFGRISDIFTESIIINESMDKMARTMNALFNRIYHVDPEDNWFDLDEFTKESNRSAAMNIRTKLRLLGLDMAEAEDSDNNPSGWRNIFRVRGLRILQSRSTCAGMPSTLPAAGSHGNFLRPRVPRRRRILSINAMPAWCHGKGLRM